MSSRPESDSRSPSSSARPQNRVAMEPPAAPPPPVLASAPQKSGPLAALAAEFLRLKELFKRQPSGQPSDMKHELRLEKRYPVYGFGHCTIPGRLHQEPVQILNVSLRGMLFRIAQPLTIGEQLLVRVQLAGAPPYEEVMAVRWVGRVETSEGTEYKIGAALVERVHVL